jgi:hypothetical protein
LSCGCLSRCSRGHETSSICYTYYRVSKRQHTECRDISQDVSFRYYDPARDTEFSTMAGILRLSTKYNICPLRKLTFQQLTVIYPPNLPSWRVREQNDRLLSDRNGRPASSLHLARETKLHSLLPSILYCCTTFMPAENIKSGHITPNKAFELSYEGRFLCLIARDKLLQARQEYFYTFLNADFNELYPGCSRPGQCLRSRLDYCRHLISLFLDPDVLMDELYPEWLENACGHCTSTSRNMFEAANLRLWKSCQASLVFLLGMSWSHPQKFDLIATTSTPLREWMSLGET